MDVSAAALEITSWVFAACAAACLVRVFIGPTGADRLTALAAISALVLGGLVILGVGEGRAAFLDVALVYDIFGFLGILAIAVFTRDFKPETRSDSTWDEGPEQNERADDGGEGGA